MAKRTRRWNEAVYRRYLREGRGQGSGASYNPWITIHDFPSLGMASRVSGQTTGRIYHLMSNLESNLFYILDWADEVTDIREQFPLSDLNRAIEIAEKALIRYPYDAVSGFPYVLTSDFYIETHQGAMAIAVKPSSELSKPRVREKLEIERRYWIEREVRWCVMTEREINMVKARNIEWLSQAKDLLQLGLGKELQSATEDFFMSHYVSQSHNLKSLFSQVEKRFGLTNGMGLNIYKYLIYHKNIEVDVEQPIHILGVRGDAVTFAMAGDVQFA